MTMTTTEESSTNTTAAPAANDSTLSSSIVDAVAEQHNHIQNHLDSLLSALQKREPLDPTYESLLPVQFRKHAKASASINKGNAATTTTKSSKSSGKKSNAMTADVKLHRRLNANLRSVVETYASTPAGWRRRPNTRRIDIDFGSSNNANNPSKGGNIDNEGGNSKELDAKLRAAFALRESKEHEQRDLVNATLKAENAKLRRSWGFSQVTTGGAGGGAGAAPMAIPPGMLPPLEEHSVRKKRLDGIAKQLREKERGAVDRAKWTKISKKGKGLVCCSVYVIIWTYCAYHVFVLFICHSYSMQFNAYFLL